MIVVHLQKKKTLHQVKIQSVGGKRKRKNPIPESLFKIEYLQVNQRYPLSILVAMLIEFE